LEKDAHKSAIEAAQEELKAIEARDKADAEFVAQTLKANIAGDVELYRSIIELNKSVDANNAKLEKDAASARALDAIYLKLAIDLGACLRIELKGVRA